jgi:hypothetical protein
VKTAYASYATQLWELTQTDWHIEICLCLTEPTCAVVNLISEDESLPKLIGFFGTDDLNKTCILACQEIIRQLKKIK